MIELNATRAGGNTSLLLKKIAGVSLKDPSIWANFYDRRIMQPVMIRCTYDEVHRDIDDTRRVYRIYYPMFGGNRA